MKPIVSRYCSSVPSKTMTVMEVAGVGLVRIVEELSIGGLVCVRSKFGIVANRPCTWHSSLGHGAPASGCGINRPRGFDLRVLLATTGVVSLIHGGSGLSPVQKRNQTGAQWPL